jgi:hypothetical protein
MTFLSKYYFLSHSQLFVLPLLHFITLLYTKTGLVFGFSRNQSLVAVIPGQKAPRTFPGLENAEDVTRAK